MAAFLDGCRFNPAAGGTTDWTFSSAVTGYQSPASANVVNGRLYKYRAESADLSQWEFGEGAYNTLTGVLARITVLYNSAGTTSKISFSTVPQVAIVALKEDLLSIEEANSFTSTQQSQGRSNLGAAYNANPTFDVFLGSPTGSSNTSTGQAMGFGASCKLAIVDGTRAHVFFSGVMNSQSGTGCIVQFIFGTGTPPANGATTGLGTIGTQVLECAGNGSSSLSEIFSINRVLTGLSPGTTYWFDILVKSTSASFTQSVTNVQGSGFAF